jgi:hypothetical protein
VLDNRRFLAVQVPESVRVLLVDGEPAADPLDRETLNLEVALRPEDYPSGGAGGRFTPFETDYVTADQLPERSLKDYAAVVLANVGETAAAEVAEIRKFVEGGGALMVFLGDRVVADFYNRYFREAGLLPGQLGQVRGDPRYPVHLDVADPQHPIPKYFEEHRESTHLERPMISFGRYFEVESLSPSARVSYRFNDTAKSPAIFDAALGAGRVLWMASSADQEWNDFSSWPDFVIFIYEAMAHILRSNLASSNLIAGEPFQRSYPAAQYASEVLLRTPEPLSRDLSGSRDVRKAMRNLPGDSAFEILHEDTAVPGLYRLDLLRPSTPGADTVEYFAVNVDPSEGDLKPMADEDFQSGYEALRYQSFDASEKIRALQGERELLRGREYWKWFLGAVLALALAETALAWLFGRRGT